MIQTDNCLTGPRAGCCVSKGTLKKEVLLSHFTDEETEAWSHCKFPKVYTISRGRK